ncbi:Uncharacterised protein [Klebsiella pneumoniae]|nr:Uncharacterised protein [Klebsiella pneumoniae]
MAGALGQTAVLMQRVQQSLFRQLAVLVQSAQHHLIRIEAQRFT